MTFLRRVPSRLTDGFDRSSCVSRMDERDAKRWCEFAGWDQEQNEHVTRCHMAGRSCCSCNLLGFLIGLCSH
jgi:hypothetical protein